MNFFGLRNTAGSDAATSPVAAPVAPERAALTGGYTIDPSHTTIGFVACHAMVTNVKGSFQKFEGTLHLDGTDPATSTASLDITMDSIETGSADRDGHLKSADFFRTDEFPTMTFRSTKAESLGGDDYRLTGDLGILGTTRPISGDEPPARSFPDQVGGRVSVPRLPLRLADLAPLPPALRRLPRGVRPGCPACGP